MISLQEALAFLGKNSGTITREAQTALRNHYGLTDENTRDDGETSFLDTVLRLLPSTVYDFSLWVSLFSFLALLAYRIIDVVAHDNGLTSLAYVVGVLTFLAEAFTEAVLIFYLTRSRHSIQKYDEHGEPIKRTSSWSIMFVLQWFSRRIFGQDLPILYYLLFFLMVVGAGFGLDFELGLTGDVEKFWLITLAILPTVGLGVIAHFLGVKVVESIQSNDEFQKVWEADGLEFVVGVVQKKAQQSPPVKYAVDFLRWFEWKSSMMDGDGSRGSFGSLSSLSSLSGTNTTPATVSPTMGLYKTPSDYVSDREPTRTHELANYSELTLQRATRVLNEHPDFLTKRNKTSILCDMFDVPKGGATSDIIKAVRFMDGHHD